MSTTGPVIRPRHSWGTLRGMVEHALTRAAAFAGIELVEQAEVLLTTYAAWLREEAIPAGGLGPGEGPAVERRHVADSLTFAVGWRGIPPPDTIVDLGSGVGLPGIPLAITHPTAQVVLVERSGRRARLARRACRVLGLENVEVIEEDLCRRRRPAEAVVARGVMPPAALLPVLRRLVAPGGVGVVGGSHRSEPRVVGYRVVPIPAEVLDQPAWLLMMARP